MGKKNKKEPIVEPIGNRPVSDVDYVIFTDGSVRKQSWEPDFWYSGYAAVILHVPTMKYAIVADALYNRTINFTEGYAVLAGLKALIKREVPHRARVAVISDSKLTVTTLSKWAYIWTSEARRRGSKVWRTTTGKPVANQKLYERILRKQRYFDEVVYAHMHSHLNKNSWKDVVHTMNKLGVKIDEKTARVFIKLNAMADEEAGLISSREERIDLLNAHLLHLHWK